MVKPSQSYDIDAWLETQEALDKLRSAKASIRAPEKDSSSHTRPEPYRKPRWSRSSSRGEDLCQHQNQRKQQSHRHLRHSYSNSSSNSLNFFISHLAVTSIDSDSSQNGKGTALPTEVIDLTLDDDENDDPHVHRKFVPAVEPHNDDRMESNNQPPKVCEPQPGKYEVETDYDADSDMEIDCDDAKDEDYREDSSFEDEDDDEDYDDYYDDSDEGSRKISYQKIPHQKDKRRDYHNEVDRNSDDPEDEVMESGIVTLRRSPSLKASPSPDHRSRSKTLVPPPTPDLAIPMANPESPMPGPVPMTDATQKQTNGVGSPHDHDRRMQQHEDQEMELGTVLWKVWCGAKGDKVTAKRYHRYYREVVLKYASSPRIRIFTDPVLELWRRQEDEEDKKRIRTTPIPVPQTQIEV